VFTKLTKDSTRAEVLAAYKVEIEAKRWPCRTDGGGRCLYRGPSGNACAIGMFLPDGVAAKLDAKDTNVLHAWPEVSEFMPSWLNVYLARSIQKAHDDEHFEEVERLLLATH